MVMVCGNDEKDEIDFTAQAYRKMFESDDLRRKCQLFARCPESAGMMLAGGATDPLRLRHLPQIRHKRLAALEFYSVAFGGGWEGAHYCFRLRIDLYSQ